MKKTLLFSAFLALAMHLQAQEITLREGRFQAGDQKEWAMPNANDASWRTLDVTRNWDDQGVKVNDGYAWYRFHVRIPRSMYTNSDLRKQLLISVAKVDDADETYLNGQLIGKTGSMPHDPQGYSSNWDAPRRYAVPADSPLIHWDEDNVIAVRVYNGGEPGGIFSDQIRVSVPSRVDALNLTAKSSPKSGMQVVNVANTSPAALGGTLKVDFVDPESGETLGNFKRNLKLKPNGSVDVAVNYPQGRYVRLHTVFTESKSGRSIQRDFTPYYILTPQAPLTPRFNTTAVYGVRPGSPVHFRFGVSGERPMRITSADLPQGLSINPENGALSGKIDRRGEYTFTVKATNAKGQSTQRFTLKVGDKIALTQPMGWNSWNCWGLSVSQDRVISSAKALIDRGLADYGYAYMNIDDGWEAPERNADGTIAVNEKFPSMKDLGDWLHSEGLKFGIYSSPGDRTCGGYLGSIDHELQDAESYNSWGIDYLKYDWCGYGRKHDKERDNRLTASFIRPYLLMEEYLRRQPRDIFYSLCQYGMADVWKWGEMIDANSWRTTGDITDTWSSMYDIGFTRNAELYPYAKPGHWNDPDMLIVGKVGWSDNLRDSRLTPDEQYTHISLWTLMSANMLIGCDIAQIDDFTLCLLCNNEVNAVHQDVLGIQAKREVKDGDVQIFKRPLADGSYAIGIFNVGIDDLHIDLSKYLSRLGLGNLQAVRDLWRQQDLSTTDLRYFVPSHGVKYLKIR